MAENGPLFFPEQRVGRQELRGMQKTPGLTVYSASVKYPQMAQICADGEIRKTIREDGARGSGRGARVALQQDLSSSRRWEQDGKRNKGRPASIVLKG